MIENHPGIYVAFDVKGRHYEYIRHPDTLPDFLYEEQTGEVERARRNAKANGGELRLVTIEWFDENIIKAKAA